MSAPNVGSQCAHRSLTFCTGETAIDVDRNLNPNPSKAILPLCFHMIFESVLWRRPANGDGGYFPQRIRRVATKPFIPPAVQPRCQLHALSQKCDAIDTSADLQTATQITRSSR
jgi:hypothetical protein